MRDLHFEVLHRLSAKEELVEGFPDRVRGQRRFHEVCHAEHNDKPIVTRDEDILSLKAFANEGARNLLDSSALDTPTVSVGGADPIKPNELYLRDIDGLPLARDVLQPIHQIAPVDVEGHVSSSTMSRNKRGKAACVADGCSKTQSKPGYDLAGIWKVFVSRKLVPALIDCFDERLSLAEKDEHVGAPSHLAEVFNPRSQQVRDSQQVTALRRHRVRIGHEDSCICKTPCFPAETWRERTSRSAPAAPPAELVTRASRLMAQPADCRDYSD